MVGEQRAILRRWRLQCRDPKSVQFERRFGDNWFGELRVRAFSGAEQGDTTYWLQKDDYVQLSLTRYF